MKKLDKEDVLFHLKAIERELIMGNGLENSLSENKYESTFVRYSFGDPKNKVETKIIMIRKEIE